MSARFVKNNDGRWLEEQLSVTHRAYAESGVAKIEKVESPYRITNKGVVALRNPFLDFIGATRGQLVCMEAKSTDEPSLRLCSERGITKRQWDALVDWERYAKAWCCVVWGHRGELKFLSMRAMERQLGDGIKSIPWGKADAIAQGVGFVLNDWLLNLRDAYGYKGAPQSAK